MTLTLNTTDLKTQRATFYVTRSLIRMEPEGVAKLFAALEVLPYSVYDDFERDCFVYRAFSPFFRPVAPGFESPEVELICSRVGRETTYSFKYRDEEDKPMPVARRYPLEKC